MENRLDIFFDQKELNTIEQFRKSNNTAMLTILFTDIVGYTKFSEDAGEVVSSKFRHLHDEMFIKTITKDNSGKIIKQIGDSFLAIFAEPSTAVISAIEFQKILSDKYNDLTYKGYTLKVRIGIHLGQVSVEDNIQPDIFGRHVNRASRIMSIAEGGQILTSHSVWDNASGWLKEKESRIESISIGKLSFKGITNKNEIFEFYSKEKGSIGVPKKIIKVRRKKQIIKLSIWGFILCILFLLLFQIDFLKNISLKSDVEISKNNIDTLYIANIISNDNDIRYTTSWYNVLSNEGDLNKYKLISLSDSLLYVLNEKIHSSLISKFYSDFEVINQSDIKNRFAKIGKAFPEYTMTDSTIYDYYKFLKDINCKIGFFFHIYSVNPFFKESPFIYVARIKWKGSNIVITGYTDNIVQEINENIYNLYQHEKKRTCVGEILSINNDELLVKFNKNSKLRVGAIIRISRYYKPYWNLDDLGVKERMRDLKDVEEFFKTKKKWEEIFIKRPQYAWSYQEYVDLKSGKIKFKADGGSIVDLGILAKVVTIYDSTAIANVYKKDFPWIMIKTGDKFELK